MTERTLILVKPDGVKRGLTGQILARIEAKGYTIAELQQLNATRELLAEHYAEHEGKPFYEPLVEFMLSGPVVAIVAEGQESSQVSARLQVLPIQPAQHRALSVVTSDATGA